VAFVEEDYGGVLAEGRERPEKTGPVLWRGHGERKSTTARLRTTALPDPKGSYMRRCAFGNWSTGSAISVSRWGNWLYFL